MSGHPCKTCGGPVAGRSDRKACSVECKRELKRAYDRARYEADPSVAVTRAREWQRANRERKQQYDAQYRELTRDRRLALKRSNSRRRTAEGSEEYRYALRLGTRKRQARKVGNGAYKVTPGDILSMRIAQRDECAYCAVPLLGAGEVDHVMPIARGGSHGVGNLVIACLPCNRSKAHRTVMEWRTRKVVPRSRTIL